MNKRTLALTLLSAPLILASCGNSIKNGEWDGNYHTTTESGTNLFCDLTLYVNNNDLDFIIVDGQSVLYEGMAMMYPVYCTQFYNNLCTLTPKEIMNIEVVTDTYGVPTDINNFNESWLIEENAGPMGGGGIDYCPQGMVILALQDAINVMYAA